MVRALLRIQVYTHLCYYSIQLHYKQFAGEVSLLIRLSFFPRRVHLAPLVPEAPQDPQEPMALRDLLVVLETLVLLEKR